MQQLVIKLHKSIIFSTSGAPALFGPHFTRLRVRSARFTSAPECRLSVTWSGTCYIL